MNASSKPSSGVGKFAQRVGTITMSATKQMPILASQVGGCVSLGQGVPSFPTPAHVVEAVHRALTRDPEAGKYSLQPGMRSLRQSVAESLARDKGLHYDPEREIAITVGAMGALADAFLALVDPGDEVILPAPTYASYIEQIHLCGGRPVFVPLRSKGWGLDVEAVGRAITNRTKALVLCNPSNPTGGVYDDQDVIAVAGLALQHGLVIISDETYDYLVYDRPQPLSPAAVPGLKEQTIVINSFSKKYVLTGWRVGYMAAGGQVMDQLMKVHDATAICAPTPGQHAALAALQGPQQVVAQMNAVLAERRRLIRARIDRLGGQMDYEVPQGAFYLLARYKFTAEPSLDLARRLIREARVVTIPGGSFGPGGEGHLRFSFGGTETVLNEAFDRIEQWLEQHGL